MFNPLGTSRSWPLIVIWIKAFQSQLAGELCGGRLQIARANAVDNLAMLLFQNSAHFLIDGGVVNLPGGGCNLMQ